MAQKLTLKEIATDLSIAAEIGGDFGYGLSEDEQSIIAEAYADDGSIETTYVLNIEIKEAN